MSRLLFGWKFPFYGFTFFRLGVKNITWNLFLISIQIVEVRSNLYQLFQSVILHEFLWLPCYKSNGKVTKVQIIKFEISTWKGSETLNFKHCHLKVSSKVFSNFVTSDFVTGGFRFRLAKQDDIFRFTFDPFWSKCHFLRQLEK
jgi:hypothetical protein